jgi:peptide/nickel transport system substrate-binding protein
MDPAKRRANLLEALQRVRQQVYTIPLHRQVIPWAARQGVKVTHRADNFIEAQQITVP